ncbi:MAG: universal stress protein [Chloroflexi bacterium]|jgi:nucleotide-binding universal stress UspA family protein|nr:universal stress protein [Chloroflexota bacterium]
MYGKILVPVDDIESAGLALTNAKDLAKATGASLVLLHVVTPDHPLVISDEHVAGVHAAAAVVEQAQQDESVHLANQQSKLQAAADEISAEGVSASAEAVLGNAHDEIVRAVKDSGADLVILSTHGRRGVSRALLGSVADEVVHDVDVPVMLVNRS